MSNLPAFPQTRNPKTFWQRTEGKWGMVVLGIGIPAILFLVAPFLVTLFGTLITLFGQAITLTALGIVLALMLMVVTNTRVQTITKLLFQRFMRSFTGFFVQLDALGIMRSYIEDLNKKHNTISKSITELSSQRRKAQDQIDKQEKEWNNEMAKASLAKQSGNAALQQISLRQAGRLRAMNDEKLIPMLTQIDGYARMLSKYREVTEIVKADLENEVKMQETQAALMKSTWGAISAAKAIIQGGTDERALFDQAMEYMADDFSMKIGQIDDFIDSTMTFMQTMDLQNGVYEAQGLARLAEWEKSADNMLSMVTALPAPEANPLAGLNNYSSVAQPVRS